MVSGRDLGQPAHKVGEENIKRGFPASGSGMFAMFSARVGISRGYQEMTLNFIFAFLGSFEKNDHFLF